MSFLDGFLGGAADAGAGIIAQNIKASQQQDLAKIESDLALERQKAIETLKAEQAEKQRQAKSERIQSQLQKNADTQFQIPGEAPATDNEGKPLTDEAKAAFANGKSLIQSAKQKFLDDPRNRIKAGVETGDENAKDLATLINDERRTASSDAANALKERELKLKETKEESEAKSRANRDKAALDTAQAHLTTAAAALKRAEKSGDAQAINDAKISVTAAFNGVRGELAAMTDTSKGAPRIEIVNGKPVGAEDDVKMYKKLKGLLDVTADNMSDKFTKKTAPPAADAPSGMKPIGTTKDGRTVFQDASGKKFVQ